MDDSPFLHVPPADWLASNRSAFAIADGFPVTEGHSLVVSRRLIATWWDATPEERADILSLVEQVKQLLDAALSPDGYNVGFNAGAAAGQTVDHLHVHVIPRYTGDTKDPRGGVRHVIPDVGNDLARPAVELTDGVGEQLGPALLRHLRDGAFDRIDMVVAFVMRSGLAVIDDALVDAVERGAQVRVLTTDYLNHTEPQALMRLHDLSAEWPDRVTVKVFSDPLIAFHPKSYLFHSGRGPEAAAYVGSSNLSRSGLDGGVEWNLGVAHVQPMLDAFNALWRDPRAVVPTDRWLDEYKRTRTTPAVPIPLPVPASSDVDEVVEPVEPRPIQREALDALEATRAAGHDAGLVVMATGLGKTWLAAFDTARPQFRRVLFVAHREEILRQSLEVFRRVQADQHLGIYMGGQRDTSAETVFASIQTLVRHLDEFAPDRFDYIVVDEFHHAAAQSYRTVLDHFSSSFLLGLTATPERMDGADLLGLCGDNLVFQVDLVEGIDRDELVPFDYHGIPDVIDFAPIPWRNGRFDPQALTSAVETTERAAHALANWRSRAGTRTLAFCSTTTHADYMADYFRTNGYRTAAVHSNASSAPRRQSVQQLEAGELDVLFAVDVFNEGFDLPAIDTVLMLRPTDSPVVFLQQLGRGLRRGAGKESLTVIDFIGNHRSFLLKPRVLLGLGTGPTPSNARIAQALDNGDWELPEGCTINWELGALDLLRELAAQRQPATAVNALAEYVLTHTDEYGERPTAMQSLRAGLNPNSTRSAGGWFAWLEGLDVLDGPERSIVADHADVVSAIESSPMTKSYKFVLLRALIREGALCDGLSLERVVEVSREIVRSDPRLVDDVRSDTMPDPANASLAEWAGLWRRQPVAAWVGEYGTGPALFRLEGDQLMPTFTVPATQRDAFVGMVAEIVEWRLGDYLLRRRVDAPTAIECAVSHSSGKPIVRFDRARHPELPSGPTTFLANGEAYEGNFVKIALNTASKGGEDGNALHSLLRGWFGPHAGLPGSRHRVVLEHQGDQWVMRPLDPVGHAGADVVPFFPTYDVACGAFKDGLEAVAVGQGLALRSIHGAAPDPDREFVAVASGDSMVGGEDPVRPGDLVLMRWARDRSRQDLVGERVLVEYDGGAGPTAALKTLDRADGEYVLRSTNPSAAPIRGIPGMTVIAEYVRTLDQREFNPLAAHLGEAFKRQDIPPLYGHTFNPGNWNTGHVSLGDDVVLFITIDKGSMAQGGDYEDHFEGPELLVWASQASVGPESRKGREILHAGEEGRRVHAWVRRRKADVAFDYCGLVVPISHTGAKPMSVRMRLLTPLSPEAQRRLVADG